MAYISSYKCKLTSSLGSAKANLRLFCTTFQLEGTPENKATWLSEKRDFDLWLIEKRESHYDVELSCFGNNPVSRLRALI